MRKRGVSQSGRRGLHAGNSSGASSSPSARTARPAPPPPFFSLSPAPLPSPRRSRVGARVWLAATDLCARKGEQRATIFLSTCGFSFVSDPSPFPLRPHPSKEPLSSRPGQRRAGRPRARARSGLRRSKNEMRLKKQGAPAPLARAPDEEEWEY